MTISTLELHGLGGHLMVKTVVNPPIGTQKDEIAV